jgi:hypothetical protein
MSRTGADHDATSEGDAAVARYEVRLQVQGDVAVIGRVYEQSSTNGAGACDDDGDLSLEPLTSCRSSER